MKSSVEPESVNPAPLAFGRCHRAATGLDVMSAAGSKKYIISDVDTSTPNRSVPTVPPPHYPGKLLSGNEAIAQAAWEAGVHVACGYPGTPSTEILETIAHFPEIKCEWSTNEKVALEIALGASFAGARSLVSMKHVGLNVAADPFFSAAYTGVNGGLVIVSADDPGMHSSQNEQDNRLLAAAARIPVLEPSSSQECRDMVLAAFDISEQFDIPVMIRTTTRVSHGKAPVKVGTRKDIAHRPYRKMAAKNILLPSVSRDRHHRIESVQLPLLRKEAARRTQLFEGQNDLAFITAGAPFFYVKEAFPHASVLKLDMVYPLPEADIREFAKDKRRIAVVEELEPFLEYRIAALGITVIGKKALPRCGELSVDIIREAFSENRRPSSVDAQPVPVLPPRPPMMCAGCSHRGTFYALKQLNAIVAGDVGCYTLGALAPLEAIDCSINMGASISMAHGMEKVMTESERKRLVAVIGDSTFFHSGISALVDVLYNNASTTTVILDNHTSAMTGHQAHPGSGETISGDAGRQIDIEALCKSLGVASVYRSNPYNLLDTLRIIDREQHREGPSVVIADAPCALKSRVRFGQPLTLDKTQCTQCFACTQLGCPAIEIVDDALQINPLLCVACGHCGQVCSDCHAGLDIPLILELMHQKRYQEAFHVIAQDSPLPAVAARVCPHPCEHDVNAVGTHQGKMRAERYPDLVADFPQKHNASALSIAAIERFLGDYGIVNAEKNAFVPEVEQNQRVSVIGSGPGGLSAAWQLRRLGYRVTVFDANPQPGGMLRYGIPDFRLPRDILDAELNRLTAIGIEFICNTNVGTDVPMSQIRDTFDATVVAVGETSARALKIKGAKAVRSGLSDGLTFLHRYNDGTLPPINGPVAVIGGGNTAIDCARAARRLGSDVTIYYRRGEADMPAYAEEIAEAKNEGVQFEFHLTPHQIASQEGAVTGLSLVRASVPGLPRIRESHSDVRTINCTQLILAVGGESNLEFLKEANVEAGHKLKVDFMGKTSMPGIFGCGDTSFEHGTVTQAISTGRRTAEAVHRYLTKKKASMTPNN